jgi:hypothetical protein
MTVAHLPSLFQVDIDEADTEPTVLQDYPRSYDHLSPEIVEFAEDFGDASDVGEMIKRIMVTCDHNNRDLRHWMEMAVSHVILLGYGPADCKIEHREDPSAQSATTKEVRHVLRVRHLDCFEVRITRRWTGSAMAISAKAGVLAWPAVNR